MLKRQNSAVAREYSRLEQYDEDEDANIEQLLHHPNSVLVANHHGQCNVVPLLSQSLQLTSTASHTSPPHSPRASFSVPDATRRFFKTKLPIVFRKDMGNTASFSSLPAVIMVDIQNGNIPESSFGEKDGVESASHGDEQGWRIIHRRKFRGKHGIGESRHLNTTSTASMNVLDEEVDPSDQVTCSVFVKWQPSEAVLEPEQHTMTMAPLFYQKQQQQQEAGEDRDFQDPIPETEERFAEIVASVRTAIESNMQPTRIKQGSSGSYFCRNTSGKIVGVFKPKNEEPYGRLNPKWTKWIHRHLFPCFFGRSCLIPNLGYLSEAAASLIDRKLGTMIVPYTDVIHMASSSFHYDYLDRKKKDGLPPKIGSFQCFLTNYKDATVFFRDHPYPTTNDHSESYTTRRSTWGGCLTGEADDELADEENLLHNLNYHPVEDDDNNSDHTHVAGNTPHAASINNNIPNNNAIKDTPKFKWTAKLQEQIRREFEQLVILDYLIRNTDRGLDNWMVKYCPSTTNSGHKDKKPSQANGSFTSSEDEYNNTTTTNHSTPSNTSSPKTSFTHHRGHIHIAAIDNGLAFPYKHPDQWRSYPYGWIAMPDALVSHPFTEATRKQFLGILSDPLWWRDTVREMRALFELDDDFDERMFQKQMAVLKGQGYNIVRTLKDPNAGPIDLVAMQRVVVNQEEILIEYNEDVLASRALHQPQVSPGRRRRPSHKLKTQRSTSFDMLASRTASPFLDEQEEDEAAVINVDQSDVEYPQTENTTSKRHVRSASSGQSSSIRPRWQERFKSGFDVFGGKNKRNKKTLNKYRAFGSDGELSDDSNESEEPNEEQEPKRVTIIRETIQLVKSRTYFTCW